MEQDAGAKARNLKNMDDETWEMAKVAAARNDETLGAWLSRAAHQLAQRERGERVIPPGQPAQPGRVPAPSQGVDSADPLAPIDWQGLGSVLSAMAAAGVPVQRRVGRQVNALLAHQLRAALPTPPAPRHPALAPPAPWAGPFIDEA